MITGGAAILIVEDSPTQAEQLRGLLETHGHLATVAASGREALAAAHAKKPTLIISDILMPEMDGYALCKAIKSDETLKDIPVLLLTVLSRPHDIIAGLECGADHFIKKPYEERKLLTYIDHLLVNLEMRKREMGGDMGVALYMAGRSYFITSERQQILDLLISTYEEAVHMNEQLEAKQAELVHLNEAMRVLNERLSLQCEIVQAVIRQATSEEEVYRILTRALRQVLPLREIIILRLNVLGDRLECVWTDPKRDDLGPDSYPVAYEPARCPVIGSGREYKVQDVGRSRTCRHSLSNGQEGAYWCVPFVIGGRTVGVLHLVGSVPGCWSEDACQWVEALVNVTAPMISHLQHLEMAKRRALVDDLTGLCNRRFLEEALANLAVRDERRKDQRFSLLMFDIDHFKAVNDQFGHQAGDLVLKTVASTVRRALKTDDLVVRYGGDEFVVALPRTCADEAAVVAERLRAAVETLAFSGGGMAHPDRATISVGIAGYPAHASTAEDLIRAADAALYRAKALGRNRVVCAG